MKEEETASTTKNPSEKANARKEYNLAPGGDKGKGRTHACQALLANMACNKNDGTGAFFVSSAIASQLGATALSAGTAAYWLRTPLTGSAS
jgi:hypothetical protein